MTRRAAAFLLGLAAFMIFEWINLGFNLADGHDTAFYVVHGILIAVNIVLAVVLGAIGLRAWRAPGNAWRAPGNGAGTTENRAGKGNAT
ncbi:hypothetical protein AB0K60_34605 [Thermopolyspora sp. NPDC052614]|uniref:SCO4848 family membrane protein n=1 Tax=Thermopolyspora sp. NPDC052614 TaxID=3155682 RepID=UPI00344587DA